jgi:rubrerythrin
MSAPIRKFLLKLVLEEAIRREEQAYTFYEEARAAVQEPAAGDLLRRLAAAELRHRLKLEELQRHAGPELTLETASPEEAELLDSEEPVRFSPGQPVRVEDVWKVALAKERQAQAAYTLLARKAVLEVFREVFTYLSAEEGRHVEWVQGMAGA